MAFFSEWFTIHANSASMLLGPCIVRSPNPIGLVLCRIQHVDAPKRRVYLSGVDLVNGTPVLDLKPYLATVDQVRLHAFNRGFTKFSDPKQFCPAITIGSI